MTLGISAISPVSRSSLLWDDQGRPLSLAEAVRLEASRRLSEEPGLRQLQSQQLPTEEVSSAFETSGRSNFSLQDYA